MNDSEFGSSASPRKASDPAFMGEISFPDKIFDEKFSEANMNIQENQS